MPTFEYKAMNNEGVPVSGEFTAQDPQHAAEYIHSELECTPLSITQKSEVSFERFLNKFRRVKRQDLINYTRQFTTMLQAGVPILATLDALREQLDNPVLQAAIEQIYNDVEAGQSYSRALEKHDDVFSEMYINSVRAGEAAGNLDIVLRKLIRQMERDEETTQELKSALRYPVIVMIGMVIAVVILVTFVIPKFAALFSQGNAELPVPTQLLLSVSGFFQNYWYFLAGGVIMLGFLFGKWVRTKRGRYQWDQLKLNVPLFGKIYQLLEVSRFAFIFQTLNQSGVPILQALQVTSDAVGNRLVSDAIQQVAADVEKGRGLAVPLKETGFFPPLVIQMISVGEESGALDEMLDNVASHYEDQVSRITDNIMAVVQPIVTLFLGIIVLVLALGVFLPMWGLMEAFQGSM